MKLVTKEYGTLEYEKDYLIHFPDGLFGFQELHDYLPLCLNEEEDSTLLVLLAVDNPDIGFVVINPFALDPDYAPTLTEEERAYLGVTSEDELTFYVTCVLKSNYLDDTVNMKCPLVVNPKTRTGLQVILSHSQYDYRHPLHTFPSMKS